MATTPQPNRWRCSRCSLNENKSPGINVAKKLKLCYEFFQGGAIFLSRQICRRGRRITRIRDWVELFPAVWPAFILGGLSFYGISIPIPWLNLINPDGR